MKRTAPLSFQEKRVWVYILGYFEDYDYSPTRKEIADALGFKTIQRVHTILRNMQRKGWLKLSGSGWRNIVDPKTK